METMDTGDPNDGLLDAPTIAPSSSSLDPQQEATDVSAGQHSTFPPQTQFIDEYELLDEIVRGSMGVVYRAKHSGLDRTVALKMILDSGDQTELSRKRFANEARAAARTTPFRPSTSKRISAGM